MRFSYIPVAALLFLLSGMGTPACPADGQHAAAALMGQFLSLSDTMYGGLQARSQNLPRTWAPSAVRRVSTPARNLLQGTVPAALRRKRYETRFGFPEGAYLSVGPPASQAPRRLRWL